MSTRVRRVPSSIAALMGAALMGMLPVMLVSRQAWAAPADGLLAVADGRLGNVVLIAACLGLGFVVVHVAEPRIHHVRVLVASGLEYIVAGIVLHQTQVADQDTVRALAPVVTFGIGSVGLLVGLRTHRNRRPRVGVEATRGAAWSSLITFAFAIGAFFIWYQLGAVWNVSALQIEGKTAALSDLLVVALVLGSVAVVSASESIVETIRHERPKLAFMGRLVTNTAWLSEIVGIVLFGLVFCVVHLGNSDLPRQPTVVEWFAINLFLGVVLGAIFGLFLGREKNEERLMVAGLGIVVFASGLAYYLNLSPILVNFIVGVVLARLDAGRLLLAKLASIEKPGFIVLFMFLGFAWDVPPLFGWLLVVLFVLARVAAKLLGAYLTYYYSDHQDRYAHGYGLALSAQGGLVAAMALNYAQVYDTPLDASLINCIVVSLLFFEFIGRRSVRVLLVNANEIALDHWPDPAQGPLDIRDIDWGERDRSGDPNAGHVRAPAPVQGAADQPVQGAADEAAPPRVAPPDDATLAPTPATSGADEAPGDAKEAD